MNIISRATDITLDDNLVDTLRLSPAQGRNLYSGRGPASVLAVEYTLQALIDAVNSSNFVLTAQPFFDAFPQVYTPQTDLIPPSLREALKTTPPHVATIANLQTSSYSAEPSVFAKASSNLQPASNGPAVSVDAIPTASTPALVPQSTPAVDLMLSAIDRFFAAEANAAPPQTPPPLPTPDPKIQPYSQSATVKAEASGGPSAEFTLRAGSGARFAFGPNQIDRVPNPGAFSNILNNALNSITNNPLFSDAETNAGYVQTIMSWIDPGIGQQNALDQRIIGYFAEPNGMSVPVTVGEMNAALLASPEAQASIEASSLNFFESDLPNVESLFLDNSLANATIPGATQPLAPDVADVQTMLRDPTYGPLATIWGQGLENQTPLSTSGTTIGAHMEQLFTTGTTTFANNNTITLQPNLTAAQTFQQLGDAYLSSNWAQEADGHVAALASRLTIDIAEAQSYLSANKLTLLPTTMTFQSAATTDPIHLTVTEIDASDFTFQASSPDIEHNLATASGTYNTQTQVLTFMQRTQFANNASEVFLYNTGSPLQSVTDDYSPSGTLLTATINPAPTLPNQSEQVIASQSTIYLPDNSTVVVQGNYDSNSLIFGDALSSIGNFNSSTLNASNCALTVTGVSCTTTVLAPGAKINLNPASSLTIKGSGGVLNKGAGTGTGSSSATLASANATLQDNDTAGILTFGAGGQTVIGTGVTTYEIPGAINAVNDETLQGNGFIIYTAPNTSTQINGNNAQVNGSTVAGAVNQKVTVNGTGTDFTGNGAALNFGSNGATSTVFGSNNIRLAATNFASDAVLDLESIGTAAYNDTVYALNATIHELSTSAQAQEVLTVSGGGLDNITGTGIASKVNLETGNTSYNVSGIPTINEQAGGITLTTTGASVVVTSPGTNTPITKVTEYYYGGLDNISQGANDIDYLYGTGYKLNGDVTAVSYLETAFANDFISGNGTIFEGAGNITLNASNATIFTQDPISGQPLTSVTETYSGQNLIVNQGAYDTGYFSVKNLTVGGVPTSTAYLNLANTTVTIYGDAKVVEEQGGINLNISGATISTLNQATGTSLVAAETISGANNAIYEGGGSSFNVIGGNNTIFGTAGSGVDLDGASTTFTVYSDSYIALQAGYDTLTAWNASIWTSDPQTQLALTGITQTFYGENDNVAMGAGSTYNFYGSGYNVTGTSNTNDGAWFYNPGSDTAQGVANIGEAVDGISLTAYDANIFTYSFSTKSALTGITETYGGGRDTIYQGAGDTADLVGGPFTVSGIPADYAVLYPNTTATISNAGENVSTAGTGATFYSLTQSSGYLTTPANQTGDIYAYGWGDTIVNGSTQATYIINGGETFTGSDPSSISLLAGANGSSSIGSALSGLDINTFGTNTTYTIAAPSTVVTDQSSGSLYDTGSGTITDFVQGNTLSLNGNFTVNGGPNGSGGTFTPGQIVLQAPTNGQTVLTSSLSNVAISSWGSAQNYVINTTGAKGDTINTENTGTNYITGDNLTVNNGPQHDTDVFSGSGITVIGVPPAPGVQAAYVEVATNSSLTVVNGNGAALLGANGDTLNGSGVNYYGTANTTQTLNLYNSTINAVSGQTLNFTGSSFANDKIYFAPNTTVTATGTTAQLNTLLPYAATPGDDFKLINTQTGTTSNEVWLKGGWTPSEITNTQTATGDVINTEYNHIADAADDVAYGTEVIWGANMFPGNQAQNVIQYFAGWNSSGLMLSQQGYEGANNRYLVVENYNRYSPGNPDYVAQETFDTQDGNYESTSLFDATGKELGWGGKVNWPYQTNFSPANHNWSTSANGALVNGQYGDIGNETQGGAPSQDGTDLLDAILNPQAYSLNLSPTPTLTAFITAYGPGYGGDGYGGDSVPNIASAATPTAGGLTGTPLQIEYDLVSNYNFNSSDTGSAAIAPSNLNLATLTKAFAATAKLSLAPANVSTPPIAPSLTQDEATAGASNPANASAAPEIPSLAHPTTSEPTVSSAFLASGVASLSSMKAIAPSVSVVHDVTSPGPILSEAWQHAAADFAVPGTLGQEGDALRPNYIEEFTHGAGSLFVVAHTDHALLLHLSAA